MAAGRLRGVLLLGGGTVLAAVLGLLFQSLLSFYFGAGAETDAWFMSLSIYAFLGKFLMLSHLKSIALPVYRRLEASDPGAARLLAYKLLTRVGLGVGLLSAGLVLAAPLLVDVLAPGYEGGIRDLTVSLVRIRTPALLFLALSTAGLVALEAGHRFGVTVSAQKIVPAGLMLILFLGVADRFGMIGLGWIGLAGGVAGGSLTLVALALDRDRRPSRGDPSTPSVDRELRSVGGQWVRFGGSNAATFVGEWAFRVAASLLPVGLFSAVLYGRMVHDLLHGAVNDSAQTVSLPRFSAAAGEDGADDADTRVGVELREALNTLFAVNVPLALFVGLTAPWSVALLFGRGRFLEDGMLGPAALALQIFAAAFLIQGLNQLLFAAAFASGRSALVNRVQIVGHLARAALLVPAVAAFSYVGLVGVQVAMNLIVFVLLTVAAPAAWGVGPKRFGSALGGTVGGAPLVGAAVMGGLWALGAAVLPPPLAVGTAARFGVLAGAALVGLGAYGGLLAGLGAPAARRALGWIRGR